MASEDSGGVHGGRGSGASTPSQLAAGKTLDIPSKQAGPIKALVAHARTSHSLTRHTQFLLRSAPPLLTKFQARGRRRRIEWPPNSQEARSC